MISAFFARDLGGLAKLDNLNGLQIEGVPLDDIG
jgi:hypothetical protein